MSKELEQTKGKIKLKGIVKGIGNENATREGYTGSDKKYKSIQFFLETSSVNRVRVELFGMERDEVIAYSSKAKASKRVPWSERFGNHGDYKVMGINCFFEEDPSDSSRKLRKVLPELDAVEYIKDNIKDGDVIRVNGEIDFQEYTNSQGENVSSQKFVIRSITKLDDELDFKSEDFKEEAKFEQDIVVSDVMTDEEVNRLYVNAKIIKYGGDVVDTVFSVDTEKYPKLAKNMAKRFGFGDFITVYGQIVNSAIMKEVESEDFEDADEDDWGGDEDIKKDFETSYMTEYVSELLITSVDSKTYEPKKYNEDDLLSEDEDAFNGDVEVDEDDDFEDDDEDLDDLPFD